MDLVLSVGSGNEKNRVVGPYPLSSLTALGCQNSGVNLCGGSPKGFAVLTGRYYQQQSSPSPTPSSTSTSSIVNTETSTVTSSPSPSTSPTPSATAVVETTTATSTSSTNQTNSGSGVTGIAVQMFDLQGISLYSRYCITGNRDFVSFGSLSSASVVTDSTGRVISQKNTPTTIS